MTWCRPIIYELGYTVADARRLLRHATFDVGIIVSNPHGASYDAGPLDRAWNSLFIKPPAALEALRGKDPDDLLYVEADIENLRTAWIGDCPR